MLESIKTGNPALGQLAPEGFLEMAVRDPEGAAALNDAMTALTGPLLASVTAAYDFSRFSTLVDVGGGHGALLMAILRAAPQLRGILFDIAPVIDGARSRIADAGLSDRCELIAGNVFDAVPAGGDAYVLKWVLHDWDNASGARILANCRAAMPPDGTLLLIERIVPPEASASPDTVSTLLSDLNMLVLSGGCERTEEEFRSLLAAAGFRLTRVVPTATPHGIIEARVASSI